MVDRNEAVRTQPKKRSRFVLLFLVLVFALTFAMQGVALAGRYSDPCACLPPENARVRSIEIDGAPTQMTLGQSRELRTIVKVDGGSAISKRVAWASSNPAVLAISPEGLVRAKAPGVATITVKTKVYNGVKKATVRINVTSKNTDLAIRAGGRRYAGYVDVIHRMQGPGSMSGTARETLDSVWANTAPISYAKDFQLLHKGRAHNMQCIVFDRQRNKVYTGDTDGLSTLKPGTYMLRLGHTYKTGTDDVNAYVYFKLKK